MPVLTSSSSFIHSLTMMSITTITLIISIIIFIKVSVVVSAFSSFRSFTTVSPGLVNLYKAQVVITMVITSVKITISSNSIIIIVMIIISSVSRGAWLSLGFLYSPSP